MIRRAAVCLAAAVLVASSCSATDGGSADPEATVASEGTAAATENPA